MTGADAGAVVAVEVFVEEDEVFPVRVVAIDSGAAVYGAASTLVGHKDAGEPPGDLFGDFPQGQILAGARGAFNLEIVADDRTS